MSNVVRPRGPKPAAVYWRRRIVVLAVAAGLVLAVTRWVGDDESSAAADQEAASSTEEASTASPSASPSGASGPRASEDEPKPKANTKQAQQAAQRDGRPAKQSQQQVSTTLQAPRGACEAGEVVVVPDVLDAEAGSPVPVRLGFSTTAGRACTLEVSGEDLALEITSGDDLIWQLGSCPAAFEQQQLVLRPGWLTYTEVAWNGRRGEDDCADSNALAEPGYYWAEAAVLSGEPTRGQFRLTEPPPPPKKKQPKQQQKEEQKNEQENEEQGRQDRGDRAEGDQREDEQKDSPDDQT